MISESEKKKHLENFKKVYAQLNPAQKRAVDTIEGPVLVVAGPGTGKTQVLTARIANILLKTDVPSGAVLALTFTESGVKAMRERLLSFIGPEAYYVRLYTFHSFCSDIIKDNPDRFVLTEELEPLSELERVQVFREIIDEGNYEILRPFGSRYYYVRALIKSIQDLKREGITPEKLDEFLRNFQFSIFNSQTKVSETRLNFTEKDLQKNRELVQVYQRYQEKLKAKSRYDFEDMINLVVEAFKTDEEFLRKYQERFQYILVDEFQDTNTPQNQVVALLASFWGQSANVFAVGDDEQSIYRFQGASLENILFFKQLYPKAQVITLKQNYRSVQNILDVSYGLIQKNRVRLANYIQGLERQLKAVEKGDKIKKVEVGHFGSGITESFFVASKIKELIASGVAPASIAVVYRQNSDSGEFADMLSRLGVSYDLQAGENILADRDLSKLLRVLRAILKVRSREEDLDLFTLFNYEFLRIRFGFNYLDTLRLARFASDLKVNFLEAIVHPDFERNKTLENPMAFRSFVEKLVEWQKDEANLTFAAFFEKVVGESGFLDWVLKLPNVVEKLNRLNSLFSQIKKLSTSDHRLNLEKFFEDLKVLEESRISMIEESLDIKNDVIALSTAHGTKGLEFDYVFIVKALDGKFGNNKVRELIKLPPNLGGLAKPPEQWGGAEGKVGVAEENEDERRLFYVALTRARRGAFITYSDSYPSDLVRRAGAPTMFLSEMGEANLGQVGVAHYETGVKKILAEILKPTAAEVATVAEKDFLKTVLADFRLSVTALNTYLECPYKFKLNNLFRTPRAKDKYLSFGSAVHRALELTLRRYRDEGRLPGHQFLLDQFEVALKTEILTPVDYEDVIKKGHKILTAYYEFHKDSLVRPIFTEKHFGVGFSAVYLDDIPLTGKVDRIDPLPSEHHAGGSHPVKVVDYKTGKPKTRNDIEGKTAAADLSYKRQLVFYKVLADLDRTFNYEVVEAELDFVEGKEEKFVKHSFIITKEETEELKRIIKETMGKIRSLEFPRTQNYERCPGCEFLAHCWPEGVPIKIKQESPLAELEEKTDERI